MDDLGQLNNTPVSPVAEMADSRSPRGCMGEFAGARRAVLTVLLLCMAPTSSAFSGGMPSSRLSAPCLPIRGVLGGAGMRCGAWPTRLLRGKAQQQRVRGRKGWAMQLDPSKGNSDAKEQDSGGTFQWVASGEREYPWTSEVAIVLTSVLLGLTTGVAVAGFKTGIKATREFVYSGPYSDLVNSVGKVVSNSIAALLNVKAASINIEYILFPLLGGLSVAAIMAIQGNNLGPGVQGIVKEIDDGKRIDLGKYGSKTAAAVATLGSGVSLGPEGPAVELGAGMSRIISEALKMPKEVSHVMISAGCAAGVAAGFNAPLSAIVFALEIVQPSVVANEDSRGTIRAAAPSVFVAASLSAIACDLLLGGGETFEVQKDLIRMLGENRVLELPVFFALGILCGVCATSLRQSISFWTNLYKGKVPNLEFMGGISRPMRPVVGSLLCGVTAAKYPQVLFFGYEKITNILVGTKGDSLLSLLTLTFVKMQLTASSIGSGLVGGIFAPSLFMGATLGSAYSEVIRGFFGLNLGSSPTYAIIGASAVLAATFRAPITAVILLFELTREYDVIVPLMATAAFATLTIDILESDGQSANPTWAWWWTINPSGGGQDVKEAVLSQVMAVEGNAKLTEVELDRLDELLEDRREVELETVSVVIREMIPDGGGGNNMRSALSKILRERGGATLNREGVDNLLLSCVGVVSSLSGPTVRLYPEVQKSFGRIDADGSGKISKEEAQAAFLQDVSEEEADRLWLEMDTDGDGEISLEEFEEMVRRKREWV